ncbi:MAG: NAD(P)H-hydrate epimerase [Phycisphaerae bacterium]
MDKPTDQLRLTCAQCRAVDKYAIEELGIPGLVLMENAGRNAADLIETWLAERTGDRKRPSRVAVICGRGNNGGDGFVVARHLVHRGHEVWIDLAAEPAKLASDAAVNHSIVEKMGVPIRLLTDLSAISEASQHWRRADVIVDALLGTGFTGAVREPMAEVIRQVNALSGPLVVAIDVPSGLDADTGQAAGEAVRAHQTITFLAEKSGYACKSARAYTGRITAVDIGAPTSLILSRLAAAQ